MNAPARPTGLVADSVDGPDDLSGASSLPAILAERAAREPDRRAYTFLNEYGEETATLTYGALHLRALAVAAQLAARCEPGDRALLAFPPGLDFIAAFFGCLYAGVVAVPINPPRRTAQGVTGGIVRDCAPAVLLSTETTLDTLLPVFEPLRRSGCGPMTALAVDRVDAAPGQNGSVRVPEWPPEAVAFLQYTSGSTSDPKGVLVTHGNLMANQRMIADAFGHDRASTLVGWTPLFHDQGLIGTVLQPLYVGAGCVLMAPTAFIRWPLLWLSAVSRYRAHTSGGPNFAFDACVARAARGDVPELDLSCWQIAFNGAEPLRAETLHRFTETFARYGFRPQAHYPCFGLAESTLLVTGSRKGRGARLLTVDADALGHGWCRRPLDADARVRTLVGSGVVQDDGGVRIVDPDTLHPCPPGRVGEIWVSGPHVARGYWRRPELTAATFQARPAHGSDRAHLRTGDLGAVVDGELYVVGRRKDLVIIRGRNLYPQDVEQTAEAAHPALRAGGCAAFGVPGPDGERLVVVQEVRRTGQRTADPVRLATAIRAAVSQEHEVALADVVLTLPNRLPKTSSGKIMRAAARQRYLDGTFERWTPPVVPTEGMVGHG